MIKCNLAICLFVSFAIPNVNFSQMDCKLDFQKVYGIEDYVLESDFDSFNCIDNLIKSKEIKQEGNFYVKYSLKKENNTNHGNLVVEYLFTFQYDKLLAYEFKINIGSNITVYKDLIKQILGEKKNLDFIKGDELKYWYTNKSDASCHKYIRLVREKKGYIIKGGISKNK